MIIATIRWCQVTAAAQPLPEEEQVVLRMVLLDGLPPPGEWEVWALGAGRSEGKRSHHHYGDAMSYYEGLRERAEKERDTTINSSLREKS